jgi:rod shape-determining protein MreD
MRLRNDRFSVIFITIVVAFVLTLAPLPEFLDLLRPYWVALVIIYWCLETQSRISLGLAFTIGIALDLLSASALGMHALSLVIIVYLVTRFRARLRFFPPWQQALSVLALLVNDRIIRLWINSLMGEPLPSLAFWVPPIVGTLIWPWLFLLLDRYRGVMRHRSLS